MYDNLNNDRLCDYTYMLGGRSIHDVFDSAEEYMIGYVIICIMTVSMEYSHLHVWLSQRS